MYGFVSRIIRISFGFVFLLGLRFTEFLLHSVTIIVLAVKNLKLNHLGRGTSLRYLIDFQE